MNEKRSFWGNISLFFAVILLVFFCLFPIVQLVSVSFKPNNEWGNVNIIPKHSTLKHYKEVLGIVPSGVEARKIEFVKQLSVKDANILSKSQRKELITKVNTWIDKTADSKDYIGHFKDLRKEIKTFRKQIRKELKSIGIAHGSANSIVNNGIEGPVDYSVTSTLAFTDSKPDKQKEILKKFNKDGVDFLSFFKNSFIFSTLSSGIAVFLSIFGAYALARLKFFGRETISKTVLLTYMVGGILLLVPLFQMASQLGFLQTPFKRAVFVLAVYIMQNLTSFTLYVR